MRKKIQKVNIDIFSNQTFKKKIIIDLSRKQYLYADRKAIQQIETFRQLKKLDDSDNATDAGNDQSIFISTILEKI